MNYKKFCNVIMKNKYFIIKNYDNIWVPFSFEKIVSDNKIICINFEGEEEILYIDKLYKNFKNKNLIIK